MARTRPVKVIPVYARACTLSQHQLICYNTTTVPVPEPQQDITAIGNSDVWGSQTKQTIDKIFELYINTSWHRAVVLSGRDRYVITYVSSIT